MDAHPSRRNAILPIHFFKIILKTDVERLKIPNKFTRRYGGGMSNPVFVKPPDGTEWIVHWTEQNGEVWFEKGWKEFAKNYSLAHGHLVLFKYEGNSQFDVLILDQSALEIDYPSSDTCGEKDNLDQSSDNSVIILDVIPPDQKAGPKSPLSSPRPHKKMRNGTHGDVERSSNLHNMHVDVRNKGDQSQGTRFQESNKHKLKGEKATQRTSSLNWPKSVRAREEAKKFISNNPFFTMLIKKGHLSSESVLNVPKFEGIESKGQNVMMQVGKRSWPVKLVCYQNRTYGRLSAGWSLFATENKLQPGDVCIFELIDSEVPALEVHVFKRHS